MWHLPRFAVFDKVPASHTRSFVSASPPLEESGYPIVAHHYPNISPRLCVEKQRPRQDQLCSSQLPSCPGLLSSPPGEGTFQSPQQEDIQGQTSALPLAEGSTLPGTSCWALRPRCPHLGLSNPPANNPVSKRLSHQPSYSLTPWCWAWSP